MLTKVVIRMDNLVVSQAVSINAPQLELDQSAKAQNLAQLAQLSREAIMLLLIQNSMEEVHATTLLEKEDPLKDGEEEEERDQEDSDS